MVTWMGGTEIEVRKHIEEGDVWINGDGTVLKWASLKWEGYDEKEN